MKNVAPLFAPLPLLIALASCSEEGTIGRESCLGTNTRCERVQPELLTYDISKARPVSSDVTREAKLAWSVDLECNGICPLTQLIDDGAGGVWILQQPGGLGGLSALGGSNQPTAGIKYKRVDEQGNVVVRGEEPLSNDEVFSLNAFARAWPHPEGGLVLPRTSSRLEFKPGAPPQVEYVHHLTRIGEDGLEDLVVGRSENVSSAGYSGPEHSFDALPSDDGFITVMLAVDTQVVRKIDAEGATIWRQVALPSGSEMVWSTIPLDRGRFALVTSTELLWNSTASSALLWFDADGNVTAQNFMPINGMGSRPAVLGLSGARVAVAGIAQSLVDDSTTPSRYVLDLHVMRLAPEGAVTGHRIVSEGLSALSFGSMAADTEDTIYVTSVTGTRRNPRGLICALPDEGDGTCYLAPQGVSPGAIRAPAPGVLYALAGEALVKLELP